MAVRVERVLKGDDYRPWHLPLVQLSIVLIIAGAAVSSVLFYVGYMVNEQEGPVEVWGVVESENSTGNASGDVVFLGYEYPGDMFATLGAAVLGAFLAAAIMFLFAGILWGRPSRKHLERLVRDSARCPDCGARVESPGMYDRLPRKQKCPMCSKRLKLVKGEVQLVTGVDSRSRESTLVLPGVAVLVRERDLKKGKRKGGAQRGEDGEEEPND